jgi:hypothetical protein
MPIDLQESIHLPEWLPQLRRIHWVQYVPYLPIAGYMLHPKQALGVVFPLVPLHIPLVCQNRWRLHEEHRKRSQPGFFDLVSTVLSRAMLRYLCQA